MKNTEEDMVRIPLSRKTEVTVYTNNRSKWPVILSAKIDTGADISSIDKFLAESLGLESIGTRRIRNAHGVEERDCVNATLTIDDIDNNGMNDLSEETNLSDDDGDGTPNYLDLDSDNDGNEDTLDEVDQDTDGINDINDNCPLTANADQLDTDSDGIGDVCDTDDDGDGVIDTEDNCPLTANADQADWNNNGIGDVCGDPKPLFSENITFIENIYPNPTDDKLTVSIKPGLEVKDLYFVDFSGKLLKPKSISRIRDKLDIYVSNLKEGIYILEIVSDKEINNIKVIISR